MIGIQMQQFNRGVSSWCESDNACVLKSEMICPLVLAWVEKKNHCARGGINRSKVSAFIAIAFGASTGQIVASGFAFVPDGDDVIYLMCVGRVILMQQAIFTAVLRSVENKTAQRFGNGRTGHGELFVPLWASSNGAASAGFQQNQDVAVLQILIQLGLFRGSELFLSIFVEQCLKPFLCRG